MDSAFHGRLGVEEGLAVTALLSRKLPENAGNGGGIRTRGTSVLREAGQCPNPATAWDPSSVSALQGWPAYEQDQRRQFNLVLLWEPAC